MGQAYRFVCNDCGYSADVCGGVDSGFSVTLETQVCKICNELVDVVIADYDSDSGETRPACKKCEESKTIDWRPDHPCPKCGKPMIADQNVIINWD
jgi:hypothetical protein